MKNIPNTITRKKAKIIIKKATAHQIDGSKLLRTDVMPLPDNVKKIRFRYFDKFVKGKFFWTKWFNIE